VPQFGLPPPNTNNPIARINDRGKVIVQVAVPIQPFRTVRGALLLSSERTDIAEVQLATLETLALSGLIGLLGCWLAFRQYMTERTLLRERSALARQSQIDTRYLSWLRQLAKFLRHEVRHPVAQINSSSVGRRWKYVVKVQHAGIDRNRF
jgi:hypothetical protein